MIDDKTVCQAVMIAQVNVVTNQPRHHPVDVLMHNTGSSEAVCIKAMKRAIKSGLVLMEGTQQPTLTGRGYEVADATITDNGRNARRADPHTWRIELERMANGAATVEIWGRGPR